MVRVKVIRKGEKVPEGTKIYRLKPRLPKMPPLRNPNKRSRYA